MLHFLAAVALADFLAETNHIPVARVVDPVDRSQTALETEIELAAWMPVVAEHLLTDH